MATATEAAPLPTTYRRVTWWELGGAIAFTAALSACMSAAASAYSASGTEENLKKMQGPTNLYVDAPGIHHIVNDYNLEQQKFHEKAKSDMQDYASRKWAAATRNLWAFLGFGIAGVVLSLAGRWRSWRSASEQPFQRLSWPARILIVISNLIQLAGVLLMIGNMIGCLAVSSPPVNQKSPVDEMRRRISADDRAAHGLAATASMIIALYGWGVHRWVLRREGNLARRWDRATLIVVCATLTIIPCVLLLALWIWYNR
jgi:hypothetical protein